VRDVAPAAAIFCAMVTGCSVQAPMPSRAAPPIAATVNPVRFSATGIASWYGAESNRKRTASGESYNMNSLTAAHRSLPLNTVVRVTNLENGKTVLVRINDRGPYDAGRLIDLSARAARNLDMKEAGTARVRLEVYDADQATPL
jgi:rare lipoprotein A